MLPDKSQIFVAERMDMMWLMTSEEFIQGSV